MTPASSHARLSRELGAWGATALGLGSILGTGVFVSLGLAAGVAGPAVVPAVILAAAVATCNGLASAQLAAAHPVAGGTYEYGHRVLSPILGFLAGWMFLAAKSASAATAALGFAGYGLEILGFDASSWLRPGALGVLLVLTILVLGGLRRTNAVNVGVVSITILALGFFVLAGLPAAIERAPVNLRPFAASPAGETPGLPSLLHAAALVFVAFTGYGRVATLGEEVRDPGRTIPRAVVLTLAICSLVYLGVAFVATATVGAPRYFELTVGDAAPLPPIAAEFAGDWGRVVLTAGAITAMAGVLLNLILGLSRVALAMGRRGDLPSVFARLGGAARSPSWAVVLVAGLIGLLALLGDVRLTWSFSALTVLVYYAITNLAAIRLPAAARRYPRWIPWAGLLGCLSLAAFIEPEIWLAGLALAAAGCAWFALARVLGRGQGS